MGIECDICGKGIYFYQTAMTARDDIIDVVWHKDCASSYEEWESKIIQKLSKPIHVDYDPEKLMKRF